MVVEVVAAAAEEADMIDADFVDSQSHDHMAALQSVRYLPKYTTLRILAMRLIPSCAWQSISTAEHRATRGQQQRTSQATPRARTSASTYAA